MCKILLYNLKNTYNLTRGANSSFAHNFEWKDYLMMYKTWPGGMGNAMRMYELSLSFF